MAQPGNATAGCAPPYIDVTLRIWRSSCKRGGAPLPNSVRRFGSGPRSDSAREWALCARADLLDGVRARYAGACGSLPRSCTGVPAGHAGSGDEVVAALIASLPRELARAMGELSRAREEPERTWERIAELEAAEEALPELLAACPRIGGEPSAVITDDGRPVATCRCQRAPSR